MGWIATCVLVCGLLVSCNSLDARDAGDAIDAATSGDRPPTRPDASTSGGRDDGPSAAASDGGCRESSAGLDEQDDAGAETCEAYSVESYCSQDRYACNYDRFRNLLCSPGAEEVMPFSANRNACGGVTVSLEAGMVRSVLHYDCPGALIGVQLRSDTPQYCGSYSTQQGRDCNPLGASFDLCAKR